MSFVNVQAIQAKIDARSAAVKNLDQVLAGEQSSMRVLRDQLTDHEVAMAERVEAGNDHIRWTTWAETRLAGMQMQLREGEQRIEKILNVIVGHEAAIKDYKSELEGVDRRPVFVAISKASDGDKPSKLEGKTIMDLDRKGPSKNPSRRYVGKKDKKTAEQKQAEAAAAEKKAAKAAKKNAKHGRQAA